MWPSLGAGVGCQGRDPDPWEDLESRTLIMVTYTTVG